MSSGAPEYEETPEQRAERIRDNVELIHSELAEFLGHYRDEIQALLGCTDTEALIIFKLLRCEVMLEANAQAIDNLSRPDDEPWKQEG